MCVLSPFRPSCVCLHGKEPPVEDGLKEIIMSRFDLEALETVDVPVGAQVLSVYLQTHSAESETVFCDRLKEIARSFEAESSLSELDQCVKRVRNFLARFEARAPMLVIFCTATGSMWVRQLQVVLPNLVMWGDTPYWKPLVEVMDEFEPYAVLLLENSTARLFNASMGEIHEHRQLARKPNESTQT